MNEGRWARRMEGGNVGTVMCAPGASALRGPPGQPRGTLTEIAGFSALSMHPTRKI